MPSLAASMGMAPAICAHIRGGSGGAGRLSGESEIRLICTAERRWRWLGAALQMDRSGALAAISFLKAKILGNGLVAGDLG